MDASLTHPPGCGNGTLHPHHCLRLYLSDDGRAVDEPTAEAQPDRRCFQQREREFSAGDTADGKRVLRQPAFPFLLQEEMEQGVD